MNARKQIERQITRNYPDYEGPCPDDLSDMLAGADAANDVWEPIVRALVDARAGENEHGVYFQTSKLREAYRLAKEALDE